MAKGHPKLSSKLGPFANMVLNSTDVSFRCKLIEQYQGGILHVFSDPTPISPGPCAPETRPSPKTVPHKLPITQTPKHHQKNKLAVVQNGSLPTKNEVISAPQEVKLQLAVMVPPLPQSSDPNEYKVFLTESPHKDAKSGTSKKRKREETGDHEISAAAKDQRALSDASLNTLQELMTDIFEAENDAQLAIDSNGGSGLGAYFMLSEGVDGPSVTLAAATSTKLDSCLNKVIVSGRFADVPMEQLCKLQNLCEGALRSADVLDVGVHADWGDDEVSSWLKKLETIDGSLRCARAILRIMAGGREEKQIYSEELLQKVFDLLSKVMDTCIIPVVECRTSGPEASVFATALSQKKPIQQLLHAAGKIMLLLLELLRKVDLAEGIITSVEFFVTKLMFVENAHAEKESVLGIHKFESFRRTAMNMIAEIFSRYSEQRRFILDETLVSLQKLPVNRQQARQYKLDDGKNIQLVSALLMRLVHSSGTCSSVKIAKKGTRVLPDNDEAIPVESHEEDDRSSSSEDSSESEIDALESHNKKKRRSVGSGFAHHLANGVRSQYDSAVSNAQYIVEFFVTRASTASKTGDQPHRVLLDMFVGDLVSVLNIPEWPAAELLLRALVSKMDRIANSEKTTAPMKNMALEVLGLAGSAVSDVTAHARQLAKTLEMDDSSLSADLTQSLEDTLSGQLEDGALLSWDGPYRAVIEYLTASNSDPQTIGARGYYLTQWTKLLLWPNSPTANSPEVAPTRTGLATKLCRMVASGKWISEE